MENINFTGGFFIQNPGNIKWKHIQELLPKRKSVFSNINDFGDKFVAVRPFSDKQMLEMLLKKKVNFKFYPDINLKSGLDSYYPDEAMKIINRQENVICTRKEQLAYKRSLASKTPFIPHKYKWTPEDHIQKTYKALFLSPQECKYKITEGITYIYDKSGKKIAIASPNSDKGINYVYVFPNNSCDSAQRLALNEFGKVEHRFSVFDIKTFNHYFKRAVKIDNSRKRPEKH